MQTSADFFHEGHSTETGHHIYSPLLPEDTSFCEFDECGDIASWACYPPDALAFPFALCDRCKQELMRDDQAEQDTEEEMTEWQEMCENLQDMRRFLSDLVVCLLLSLVAIVLSAMCFSVLLGCLCVSCAVLFVQTERGLTHGRTVRGNSNLFERPTRSKH